MFPVASPQQLNLHTALQHTPTSPSVTRHPDTRSGQALSDSLMGITNSPTWFLTEVEESESFHCPDMLDDLSGGLLADTRQLNPNYGATNTDNSPRISSGFPQYIEASEPTCNSSSTSGDKTPSTFSTENAFSRTLSRVDRDLRLSKLSVDLCQQAKRNMVVDQQSDRSQVGADQGFSEVETGPEYLNGYPPTSSQSKEFGDALCSTSEFMAIIESKHDDTELDDPSAMHESHWPLIDLSCGLNLLSCYLLTVAVFERLVLRLYEQMTSGNETPTSVSSSASHLAGPQTLPGLHLANFHVQQSNLQTKILMQIIEHQFEMIERSLGLPVELRVSSGRGEPYECGLLQSGLDEGLLQAVITHHSPVSGSLASLRENILKVRQLLAT